MSELERSGSKDPTIARVEQRVSQLGRTLGRSVDLQALFAGARLLTVTLTTSDQAVEHGLLREPVGAFLVAGGDGSFDFVWSAHPSNPTELILASATSAPPGVVSIVVF